MNSYANGPIKKDKEFYTEQEAADLLGISVARLYMLLDQNVFNDGGSRPRNIELTSSDIVLLQFWNRAIPRQKVVAMPKRRP
ncbi:MAG TPA: hypothetical protein VGL89_05755 [Candidatus Koribacter sp.]|jgi:hypothetical protein